MSFQPHPTDNLSTSIKLTLSILVFFLCTAGFKSLYSKFHSNIKRFGVDFVATFSIFLLCLNFYQFSANHVVCIELSKDKTCKSHLQQYHCKYSQDAGISAESAYFRKHSNIYTPVTSFSATTDNAHCPNCIDEHIQFTTSSSAADFKPILHTPVLDFAFEITSPLPLLSLTTPALPFLKQIPKTSYVESVIRTTVLLI